MVRFRQRVIPGGALVALLLSTFMGYLDTFIVNVAAPSIQTDLGASFAEIQLTISGYTGAYAVGLVLGGRLGDAYGHRRLWLTGLAGFVAASVLCALAPTGAMLVVARILQGGAAAAALPQTLAIIRVVAGTGAGQRRALAWYGAIAGIAALSGQLIGGLLVQADVAGLSWRAIFLVNVPIGVIAMLIGARTISATTTGSGPSHLDGWGALLLAGAVGLTLFPLIVLTGSGWSPLTDAIVAIGLVSAVGFVLRERRLENLGDGLPLLRLSLLRRRQIRRGLLVISLYFAGNAGLYLILAYYEQSGLGLSPAASGLTFLPLGLGFVITSTMTTRAVRRWGSRVLVVGALLVAASLPVLYVATLVPAPRLVLMAGLLMHGLGEGLLDVPLLGFVLAGTGEEVAGAMSGMLLTTTQIAAVLSVVLTGAVFAAFLGLPPRLPDHSTHVDLPAYSQAFAGTDVCFMVLSTVTVLAVTRLHRCATNQEPRRLKQAGLDVK